MPTPELSNDENISCLSGKQSFFSHRLPAALALELNQLLAEQFQDVNNTGRSLPQKNTRQRRNAKLEIRFRQMQKQWPLCVDPYIALFKLYFRTAAYSQAEREVWSAMSLLSSQHGFSSNYRLLHQDDADWLASDSDQRQFLFCMKALGVIRLRRGKIFLAKKVLGKLAQLDPYDEIGGASYRQIAESFDEQP